MIAVYIHIAGAVLGLLSGALAMIFRKGSGLHGAAGTVFFASMVTMSLSAVWAAIFHKPNPTNVMVGAFTFYLVITAWRAARQRDGRIGAFDVAAMMLAAIDGVAFILYGLNPAKDMPLAPYLIFGSIALFCVSTDVRMLRRGGFVGRERIVRHLGRMGLALLIAVLSFYPGQARIFPKESRSALLFLPHVLLVGSLIYWRVRYRAARKRDKQLHAELPMAA